MPGTPAATRSRWVLVLLQLLPLYGRAGRHCTQAAQHRRQAAQHLLTCLRPGLSHSPSAGAHWHRELSHRHPQRHGGPRAAAGKVVGLRPAGRIACSLLSHPYTCAPLHLPCLPSLLTGGAAFQPAVFLLCPRPSCHLNLVHQPVQLQELLLSNVLRAATGSLCWSQC